MVKLLFEYIIGDVVDFRDDSIILQNNNIGYRIFTSVKSKLDLNIGDRSVLIYTELIPREDSISLYGFTTKEEMDMFNLLILVSRIGPKVGLSILSALDSNTIKAAIVAKDKETLCKAPGIGKKTAERIILELRDRIDESSIVYTTEVGLVKNDNGDEAVEALLSLGYTRYEVEKSLKLLDTDDMTTEDIIKVLLKTL